MKFQEEDKNIAFHTSTYELLELDDFENKFIELDLGCGTGSFTASLAMKYPQREVLAADVMVGRLRKLTKKNIRLGIENMKLFRVEARHLVAFMLPDKSINRLHLLCPDPWPKERHRGHRLLTSDFCSQLHRVLKDDGVFHFSSDDEYYFDAVASLLRNVDFFVETPEKILDIADIKSDFEERWLSEGKAVRHIAFSKIPKKTNKIGH